MQKQFIKYITLFSSIITLILGGIIAFAPLESNVVINYLLVIGLGILGIAEICKFASLKENSAWDLVTGILCLMACLILLSNGALFLEATAGYILAAIAIIAGIGRFFMAYNAHKLKFPMSGFIIAGIILILLGICLIVFPIMTQALYTWLLGIFLIAGGIVGIINAFTIKTGKKKK